MRKIILIAGKARSGKDTFATALKNKMEADGYRVKITHYADLLKYICKEYLNWDGVKDDHGRTLLQYVGTEVFREKNPNYWVHFVLDCIRASEKEWDYVIIPDCRFPNEVEVVENSEFETVSIKITRDSFDNNLEASQKQHSSETSVDKINTKYHVRNNGTIENLNNYATFISEEYIYEQNH